MSDHTHGRFEIVAVADDDEAQAVLKILNDFGLSTNGFDSFPGPNGPELELGAEYIDTEFTMGQGDDLATQLLEKAPGATWEFIEDPNYEFSGTYHCHIPALGYYAASCNGEGQPVFTADQVLNMTKLSETSLIKELGLPWQLEFRRKSNLLNGEPLAPRTLTQED